MVRCKKHSFWALDIRPANDNERQTPAKKLILGKERVSGAAGVSGGTTPRGGRWWVHWDHE